MGVDNGFEKVSGGIMITGDGIDAYRLMALIKALEIEIRTGMVMSRGVSALKIAQNQYGVKARRKKDAVIELKKVFNQFCEKEFYKV